MHEKNVVWAALLPDEPGTVAHPVGDGEHPSSVFLRFHPSRVGELFPTKTIEGHGPERAILHARRMYAAKIRSGWQSDDWPVIPKKSSIVFDCETTEGRRRYYTADLDRGTVDCVDAFKTPVLRPLVPIEPAVAVEAFEAAWRAFDEEYPKFDLVPDVDCRSGGIPPDVKEVAEWERTWLVNEPPGHAFRPRDSARAELQAARVPGVRASAPSEAFAGAFGSPLYGTIVVVREGEGLTLTVGRHTTELEHWQGDSFYARAPTRLTYDWLLTFEVSASGTVGAVTVHHVGWDADEGDQRFVRQP